jgi:hypothetical protein
LQFLSVKKNFIITTGLSTRNLEEEIAVLKEDLESSIQQNLSMLLNPKDPGDLSEVLPETVGNCNDSEREKGTNSCAVDHSVEKAESWNCEEP